MLEELRVENLLLIESAQLRLAPGLNVLTGETGAGKTVLAHALDLLLGGRARPGIVRPGASEAYVEGIFELTPALRRELGERLPADAGEVILARRVGADGRTRAYLNGRSATVTDLRDVGARLLAFYGQHEHRKLTLSAAQLEILDGTCGPEQGMRLSACASAHAETVRLAAELDRLRELSDARERELELLEHELAEIDAAAPQEREHEELLAVRERLRRLDALCSAAGAGADALAPDSHEGTGVAQALAGSVMRLEAVAGLDPQLDSLADRLRALAIESQEIAGELRDYSGRSQADELDRWDAGTDTDAGGSAAGTSLDLLEERLAAIERLQRKHGGSIQSVLDYGAAARQRRDELAGAEVALARTREFSDEAGAALDEQAGLLRRARRAAAPRLALAVHEQLSSLAMADASFEVVLAERQPGPSGADSVEFVIAPNPGVPAGPLREIASGGELSRVMLALITACERVSGQGRVQERGEERDASQATLVFDEVDAGIGGHAARAVGARLRELGVRRQVLCITHLPQIASLGERHFSIVKDTSADPTRASVLELAEGEVVSELVRMLGADSDDSVARRHARELRRAA
ncbi:MAG TPA: AAA family ATPase [Solirubrobacteraceae bacterium]|jgi:DNA repair protein RecN (Recombination protein N)|nr:AAA family ATPase [Solirubrobacteraceae bacterium]